MADLVFSIATLVTDHDEYNAMRESFTANGFDGDCEFFLLDNSETNTHDGYRGFNTVLQKARGEYVIFCHQDVRLDFDGRDVLEKRLAELDDLDPAWALAGNAGGLENGSVAIRITDPRRADQRTGAFPSRVCSLDSNFFLVKNETRVAFSRDLYGFYFYGSDICMQAEMRGYRAYVIDFHLRHLSAGNVGQAFFDARARFMAKWGHAMRRRFLRTTVDFFLLEGAPVADGLESASARDLIDLGVKLLKCGGRPRDVAKLIGAGIRSRRRRVSGKAAGGQVGELS
jgi:hypothetical protein